MSLLSPDNFALALFSLMKMGKEAREAHYERRLLQSRDVQELGRHVFTTLAGASGLSDPGAAALKADVLITADEKLRVWAATTARAKNLLEEGAEFEGVVQLTQGPATDFVFIDRRLQVADEVRFQELVRRLILTAARLSSAQQVADRTLIELQQAEWLRAFKAGGGSDASPWSRFAFSMLDYSLDLVAERPDVLGGGRQMRGVIAALVPAIAEACDPKTGTISGLADRLPTVFAQAALGVLIEKPELVSSEARWQRLITGVLVPLQAEVARDGSALLAAEGRLRDLIEGRLAPAALKIISDNAGDYLKGSAANDRIAGAVLRATLGEYVSTGPASAPVRKLFGPEGIERIVFHALEAARMRPELFIPGNAGGPASEALRTSLAAIAGAFQAGGRINPLDGALAADLYCIGLDAVSDYMIGRLRGRAGGGLQAAAGAEIAALLMRDIVEGLKRGAGAPSGGDGLPALTSKLGQAKLGEICRIIAEFAARSPDVFLSKEPNAFVVDVTRLIAGAVLDDADGLLSPREWQAVALASFEAALENPNTLFGRLAHGSGEDIVARRLIGLFLRKARENFARQKDTAGQVLFGKVLEEAIIATLDAASTGILNVLASKAEVEERLLALEDLIDRLNALAASRDPSLIIGSRDWIRIYSAFVTDVLHRGRAATDELTNPRLIQAIHENHNRAGNQAANHEGAG